MDFITLDMFYTLAGCVVIVGLIVEGLKHIPKIEKCNPLYINFFVSLVVGVIRMFIINDLSWQGIVLGLLNVFVIMFAAAGGYDTITTIIGSVKGNKE